MPSSTSNPQHSSDVDHEAIDSDTLSEIDPDSVAPTPPPGERIATVLTIGPSPFFVQSRRKKVPKPVATIKHQQNCICGPTCRCCKNDNTELIIQTVLDRERIKAERREQRARMERREKMIIEKEEEMLRCMKSYFYLGCFGLPLVHFVAVVYFLPELRDKHNSNFRIQQYGYMALAVGVIESLVWIAWFILFQLIHDDERVMWMQKLNILNNEYNISSLV